jgi:hypothetical protein
MMRGFDEFLFSLLVISGLVFWLVLFALFLQGGFRCG